jgi:hypothetical protein
MTDGLRRFTYSSYEHLRGGALTCVKGLPGDFTSLASYRIQGEV